MERTASDPWFDALDDSNLNLRNCFHFSPILTFQPNMKRVFFQDGSKKKILSGILPPLKSDTKLEDD